MTTLGFGVKVAGLVLNPEPIATCVQKPKANTFHKLRLSLSQLEAQFFSLALYLTGVLHFRGALQHDGHVGEQKFNKHINIKL